MQLAALVSLFPGFVTTKKKADCRIQHKTNWKGCLLEVGRMDFSPEILGIQLLCNVKMFYIPRERDESRHFAVDVKVRKKQRALNINSKPLTVALDRKRSKLALATRLNSAAPRRVLQHWVSSPDSSHLLWSQSPYWLRSQSSVQPTASFCRPGWNYSCHFHSRSIFDVAIEILQECRTNGLNFFKFILNTLFSLFFLNNNTCARRFAPIMITRLWIK